MAEKGRECWIKRVEQWRQSKLSAREFAAQAGFNAGTLGYWKWRLAREARQDRGTRSAPRKRGPRAPELVELAPVALSDDRVEIELSSGHRVRVPPCFDAASLTRIVS